MSTPDELINDARNYAISVTSAATSALVGAMNTVNQIGQGSIGGKAPQISLTLPTPGDPGTVPQYHGTIAKFDKFTGTKPTLDNVNSADFPSDPGAAPAVAAYTEPPLPMGTADASLLGGVPIVNTAITAPPAPNIDVNAIQKPVVTDPTIPTIPNFTPPEFTGVKPALTDAPPTGLDVLMKTEYSTVMPIMVNNISPQIDAFLDREFPQFRTGMAQLEARLATYLAGGSALSPAVENAIFNRTLDRTDGEMRRAKDESWGKAARAGWTMPTLALLNQLDNVDQERRRANAQVSNEIMIKQAELEQSNLQFAVTQSASLRQVMLSTAMAYFSGLVQINGQALEYARGVVDSVTKAYELATQYASLQTRIYESEATVYRARLEGELAKIQAYEAQIRGVQAQVEVDTSKVNLYRAQLDGAMTQANVYKTQVEAVEAAISIEKMKVELYGAKVNAYVSQVNGYTAQWQGYAAAVSGQRAKIEASAEQIRAYSARVGAYQAMVSAKATEIESRVKVNAQRIETYRTEVEAYRSLIGATAEAVGSEINSYNATIQAFIAKANAISEKSRAEIAVYEVAQRGVLEGARLTYDYIREQDGLNVARASGASRIAESIGGIYAGIAESTLAGMNTLAASTQTTSA